MTRMLGALLALFVLCSPTMAVAHAILLRTAPLDGAVLQQSPDKLAFQFNETVVPVSVRLVDATGRTLAGPDGAVSVNGEVALPLPTGLPPGRYIASYRVASADTHPIAGAIQFAVGEIGTEPLSVPTQEIAASNWSLASIGVRFVRDVALSLGVGGIFFSLAIARQKILTRFFSAALGVAAIASLAGVGVAGARLTQASTLFDASVWLVGAKFSAANAAILILAGLAISARALQRAHAGLAAAGLGLVAWGTAATGHAATGSAVAVLAQTLHSFCAFLWLGAFLPLHAFAAHKALAPLQQAARRFSDIGLAMLAGLALGALYLAATRVTLETAFESDYARMLGAKAALIGALLVIAAQNRWRLVPLLASHATARARLRRNLRLDMALGVALVALTAVLSHTPPMGHDGAHHHPPNNGKTLALMREGHQLTLQVVGTTLDLYLATPTLQPFEPLELQLELASSERSVEALRIATARIAPGHYRAQVPLLAGGGSWQLRLDTLVTDFKKIVFETTLDVP